MSYIGNSATQQQFIPAVDYFNGNGSTTAFTLSRPVASVMQVQAVIENVPQNPGSAFTVSGSTITFTSAPPSGSSNIYVYYTSPITQVIAPSQGTVYPSSLSTGGLYWDTSGNISIGTTTTVEKLTVFNSGITSGINLTNTGASGRSYSIFSTSSGALTVGCLGFYDATAAAYRMIIESNGDVAIGNTGGKNAGLAVKGNAKTAQFLETTNSADGIYVLANTGGSSGTAVYVIPCRFGSTQVFGGGVYWTGSVMQYTGTSDVRLKENIVDSDSGLKKLSKVKIRSFDWKESGNHVDFGVIAQELEEIAPEAVALGKDNEDGSIDTPYAVDTSVLVPAMIKAIQELKAEIDLLKAGK